MTTSPIAGDSQIATALTTLGTTALGSTRNELLTQLIVAAANATGGGSGSVAFADITGLPSDNAALQAALDTKLALAGGDITGQLINSANGAASTPSLLLSGTPFTGGSATTTKPLVNIEPTGTTSTGWSTSGTMLGVNAPSGFAGNLADWQLNGVSKAYVDSVGNGFVSQSFSSPGTMTLSPALGSGGAYLTLAVLFGVRSIQAYNASYYVESSHCFGIAGAWGDAMDVSFARTSAGVARIANGSTGRATLDAAGYQVGGVAGASFGPGAVTSITVVNGLITAIS